jgi:hypothetical protein
VFPNPGERAPTGPAAWTASSACLLPMHGLQITVYILQFAVRTLRACHCGSCLTRLATIAGARCVCSHVVRPLMHWRSTQPSTPLLPPQTTLQCMDADDISNALAVEGSLGLKGGQEASVSTRDECAHIAVEHGAQVCLPSTLRAAISFSASSRWGPRARVALKRMCTRVYVHTTMKTHATMCMFCGG